VYRARYKGLGQAPLGLKVIATLNIPDPLLIAFVGGITGGDIAPDGRHVVLSSYLGCYEAVLPAGADFDRIWEQHFTLIPIGIGSQVEGICYRADGRALIATSEGLPCPLIEIER